MKKSHKHNQLSQEQCTHDGCKKFIKQRLVNLSDRFKKCYKHHCEDEAKRGHHVNTTQRRKRVLAGLPVKLKLTQPKLD